MKNIDFYYWCPVELLYKFLSLSLADNHSYLAEKCLPTVKINRNKGDRLPDSDNKTQKNRPAMQTHHCGSICRAVFACKPELIV